MHVDCLPILLFSQMPAGERLAGWTLAIRRFTGASAVVPGQRLHRHQHGARR